MASNTTGQSRFRYGICLNDKCQLSKEQKVQQILAHKDFVCTECGKPLSEVQPPSEGIGKGKIILAIVIAVLAIGGALFWVYGPGSKPSKTQEPIVPEEETVDDTSIGTPTNVAPLPETGSSNETIEETVNEEAAEAVNIEPIDDEKIKKEKEEAELAKEEKEKKENLQPASSNRKNLGWGVFEATSGTVNDGIGIITVNKSYSISTNNGPVQVEKGDKIVNAKMQGGRLIMGEVHRENGTRVTLSLGAV